MKFIAALSLFIFYLPSTAMANKSIGPIPSEVSTIDLDDDGKDETIVNTNSLLGEAGLYKFLSFYKTDKYGAMFAMPFKINGEYINVLHLPLGKPPCKHSAVRFYKDDGKRYVVIGSLVEQGDHKKDVKSFVKYEFYTLQEDKDYDGLTPVFIKEHEGLMDSKTCNAIAPTDSPEFFKQFDFEP